MVPILRLTLQSIYNCLTVQQSRIYSILNEFFAGNRRETIPNEVECMEYSHNHHPGFHRRGCLNLFADLYQSSRIS